MTSRHPCPRHRTPARPMLFLRALRFSCTVAALAALLGLATPAGAQCNTATLTGAAARWEVGPGQRFAGPIGPISTLASFDFDGSGPQAASLVAGGAFSIAGIEIASNIARWDGAQWHAVGAGFDGPVLAATTFNGELIVAGSFSNSGTTDCSHIARWNAAANAGAGAWQSLGSGVDGPVHALAIYGNRLYVGGEFHNAGGFYANGVASWDGAAWQSVGTGGANGGGGVQQSDDSETNPPQVRCMTVFDSHLYVGGAFNLAAGIVPCTGLAIFNGTSWSAGPTLATASGGLGSVPTVNAMSVFTPVSQFTSTIYITGNFLTADGASTPYIARQSNPIGGLTAWNTVGSGLPASGQAILLDASSTTLNAVLVSVPAPVGSSITEGIYRYASSSWSVYLPEAALCLGDFGGTTVGGVVNRGSSPDAGGGWVGRRVGTSWLPFGNGLNATTKRIVSGPDIPGGADLYAIGPFTVADQQVVNQVARLDAAGTWHPVGSGIPTAFSGQYTTDLAILGSDVFVCLAPLQGDAWTVLRFDGSAWITVASFTSAQPAGLYSLPSGLYLRGTNIARWTGSAFTPVGVWNLAPALDLCEHQGHLIAPVQGTFYIFDGTQWNAAYSSGSLTPSRSVSFQNRLFITGRSLGNLPSIRELSGSSFVVSKSDALALDFLSYNDTLLAVYGNTLGRLNFLIWGSAANLTGNSLSIHRTDLIVGGTTTVSGLPSPVFARLVCCPPDFNRAAGITVQDVFDFLNAWFAGDPRADFDGINGLQVADIFAFLNAWFAGC